MSSRNHPETIGKESNAGSGEQKLALPARVRSRDLLRDGEQLIIEHAGREYRLRVTSNGKLILTA